MKILFLTPHPLTRLGGVETHVQKISQILKECAHEVTIFTINQPNQPISSWAYKLNVWRQIWTKRQLFREADIVHIHDVFWWILPIYPLIYRKVFITFHGWEGRYPVPWSSKLQRLIYAQLSRGTIHVGAWISKFYLDKPDKIVYGGV